MLAVASSYLQGKHCQIKGAWNPHLSFSWKHLKTRFRYRSTSTQPIHSPSVALQPWHSRPVAPRRGATTSLWKPSRCTWRISCDAWMIPPGGKSWWVFWWVFHHWSPGEFHQLIASLQQKRWFYDVLWGLHGLGLISTLILGGFMGEWGNNCELRCWEWSAVIFC